MNPTNPLADVVEMLASTSNALRAITTDLAAHRKPSVRARAVVRLREMADDLERLGRELADVAATGAVEAR